MPSQRTTEQIQYEKLTSLFKTYAGYFTAFLGLVSTIMGILAGFILWTTNSDRNAMTAERKVMQDDYKQTIKELKDEIKAVKTESKESIEKINQNAENELQRVNFSTNRIALEETQKQLSNIFGTERIQNLIKDQAVKEVKSKVVDIVNDETKNFYSISNAATQMRMGKYEGLDSLMYFSKNLPRIRDKEVANQLYNQICFEFQKIIESTSNNIAVGTTTKKFKDAVFREKYNIQTTTINTDDERFKSISDADTYEYLMQKINNKNTDLTTTCHLMAYINHFSNNNFRAFEFDKMNKWYRVYVKSLK